MTGSFRDLIVYHKAYEAAKEIFEITKSFPKEERYSLTDEIRRSSRSVCAALGEGYRKRIYPKLPFGLIFQSIVAISHLSNTLFCNRNILKSAGCYTL